MRDSLPLSISAATDSSGMVSPPKRSHCVLFLMIIPCSLLSPFFASRDPRCFQRGIHTYANLAYRSWSMDRMTRAARSPSTFDKRCFRFLSGLPPQHTSNCDSTSPQSSRVVALIPLLWVWRPLSVSWAILSIT
jgi:hypothetical protein